MDSGVWLVDEPEYEEVRRERRREEEDGGARLDGGD